MREWISVDSRVVIRLSTDQFASAYRSISELPRIEEPDKPRSDIEPRLVDHPYIIQGLRIQAVLGEQVQSFANMQNPDDIIHRILIHRQPGITTM